MMAHRNKFNAAGRLLLALVVLPLPGGGAQAQARTDFPLSINHDYGTQVFKSRPARVIVTSEEEAELLSVLGIKPVGYGSGRFKAQIGQPVPELSTLAKSVLGQASYVGNQTQPSLEVITALKPDLLLISGGTYGKEFAKRVGTLAPVLAYDYDKSGWRQPLLDLGKLFGRQTQAQRYLKNYDDRLALLKNQMAPVAAKAPDTTLLFMYQPDKVTLLGRGFSFSHNLTALGLRLNAPAGIDPNISFRDLSPEELLNLKTDRILLLRRINDGKMVPKNSVDEVLKKLGKPVLTYPLDPQEASSGPLTDLKRAESLAKLIH